MEYEVRLEQLSSRPLAVVRRRASSHELAKVVPDACGAVWNVVRAQKIAGAGRHVAVYLDGQINLEVGVELEAPFAGFGEKGNGKPSIQAFQCLSKNLEQKPGLHECDVRRHLRFAFV